MDLLVFHQNWILQHCNKEKGKKVPRYNVILICFFLLSFISLLFIWLEKFTRFYIIVNTTQYQLSHLNIIQILIIYIGTSIVLGVLVKCIQDFMYVSLVLRTRP